MPEPEEDELDEWTPEITALVEAAGLEPRMVTAFVVALDISGNWRATANTELMHLVALERVAGMLDIMHGTEMISADARHTALVADVSNNIVGRIIKSLPTATADAIGQRVNVLNEQAAAHTHEH